MILIWIHDVKQRYISTQIKAAVKVNTERLYFNWQLGRDLVERKAEEECEKKFAYYGNGTIVGDEYTINLLNLNDYELREARRAVYQQLQHLDKETIKLVYMNEQDEEYQPYYNVIKWYVNG